MTHPNTIEYGGLTLTRREGSVPLYKATFNGIRISVRLVHEKWRADAICYDRDKRWVAVACGAGATPGAALGAMISVS
jgi:hypothetical protein